MKRIRIPEETWATHKATIRRLYCDENLPLQGKGGIIEKMMQDHDFHASKSQYETRLKKWDIHRNATREDWIALDRVLANREARNKDSHVYIHGKPIEEHKLRRQRIRYVRKNEIPSTTPHLPAYIRVSTPSPGEDKQESLIEPKTHLDFAALGYQASSGALASTISSLRESWQPDYEGSLSIRGMESLGFDQSASSTGITRGFDRTSVSSITDLNSSATMQSVFRVRKDLSSLANSMLDQLDVPTYESFSTELKLYVPREDIGIICSEGVPTQFAALLVSLLVNNSLPYESLRMPQRPNEVLIRKALKYLHTFNTPDIHRLLHLLSSSFIQQAMEQSLFCSAVELGSAKAIKALLTMGISPDQFILMIGQKQYTPIERSAYLGHTDVIRYLLEAGADPDLYFQEVPWKLCLQSYHQDTRIEGMAEAVGILLSAKVDRSFETLIQASSGCGALVPTLANKWPKEHWTHFINISEEGDQEQRAQCQVLLPLLLPLAKDNLNEIKTIPNSDVFLQLLFSVAARANATDYLDTFLASGILPTPQVLKEAACHGSVDFLARSLDESLYSIEDLCLAAKIAIEQGNDNIIKLLVERGEFSKMRKNDRGSLIALAACLLAGAEGTVQRLLPSRDTIRSRKGSQSHDFNIAVHVALRMNRTDVFLTLVEAGASPNIGIFGLALKHQNKEALAFVLQDASSQKWIIKEAFLEALNREDLEMIKTLVSIDGKVCELHFGNELIEGQNWKVKTNVSCLSKSILSGHQPITKFLLDNGAFSGSNQFMGSNDDDIFCSPLSAAIFKEEEKMISDLLERGANPWDPFALWLAVKGRHTLVVHLLLEAFRRRYSRKPARFGGEALQEAIKQDDVELVRMIASIADCNMRCFLFDDNDKVSDSSALGTAISHRTAESSSILRIILDCGGDPNSIVFCNQEEAPKLRSMTALLYAIGTLAISTVKTIVETGAVINRPAEGGVLYTPLQFAAAIGAFEIVQFLLKIGADPNQRPAINGLTALQHAAKMGFVGIAETLICAGADVNAPASGFLGRSAFESAAEFGRLDMIMFLVRNGVDLLSNQEEQYHSALKFAEANKQPATIELVGHIYSMVLGAEATTKALGAQSSEVDLYT